MQDWQIDLLKMGATAVLAGIGGWWGHWAKNRERQKEADLREQQRQAEYEEFKKKRRLVGGGEVERMERAAKLTDIIIKQKQHGITPEQFIEAEEKLVKKKQKRDAQDKPFSIRVGPGAMVTKGANGVVSIREEPNAGPNGYPIGYLDNGDKVEFLPTDDDPEQSWPMILLRNENDIHEAEKEFYEKVWWNRHQIWKAKIEAGKEPKPDPKLWETATKAAKRIEDKYGVENLGWDDFEWGMINGKLSALRWVTGAEWDFLDT